MNTPEIVSTARVVLRDENDQILMPIRPLSSKQRPGDGDFFGGKVDAGEYPIDAAAREVAEETGRQVATEELSFLYGVSEKDNDVWFSRMYFLYGGRLAVRDVKNTPEHIGLVCASKPTALTLTEFVPHQQALKCIG